MKYGYKRPATPVFDVVGTGASFLTDVLLDNGNPSDITLIQWLSDVTPTTSDYIDLQSTWSAEVTPGIITIQGLSCPEGTLITATGKRTGDTGFPYALASARTFAQPDGRIDLVMLLPAGLDPLIGLQLRIYNDSNSVTWAGPATEFGIGEADLWQAVTLRGKQGWRDIPTDPSIQRRMLQSGLDIVPREAWRTLTVEVQRGFVEYVRENGLEHGEDWHTLRAKSFGNSRAFLIIENTDEQTVYRSSVFGKPTMTEIANRVGMFHVFDVMISVAEVR